VLAKHRVESSSQQGSRSSKRIEPGGSSRVAGTGAGRASAVTQMRQPLSGGATAAKATRRASGETLGRLTSVKRAGSSSLTVPSGARSIRRPPVTSARPAGPSPGIVPGGAPAGGGRRDTNTIAGNARAAPWCAGGDGLAGASNTSAAAADVMGPGRTSRWYTAAS